MQQIIWNQPRYPLFPTASMGFTMGWRVPLKEWYRIVMGKLLGGSIPESLARNAYFGNKPGSAVGGEDQQGMEQPVDESYRQYVHTIANGGWPSEVILNRNSAHASVIIEVLFEKATRLVEILTGELSAVVYGTPQVIAAASAFLRRDVDAKIHILYERSFNINAHPLIKALCDAGLGDRVYSAQVPDDMQGEYECHFAVADRRCYRFEASRQTHQAIVQFGEETRGSALSQKFRELAGRSYRE